MLLRPIVFALSAISKNNVRAENETCTALSEQVATLFPNITMDVYASTLYPDNTTFVEPTAILGYNSPVPNLPSFCRFGAYFNTSSSSRVQFEVWFPTPGRWNGRMAMVGNGGDAGGVNYPDMWGPLAKYNFATVSTDTGHNGTAFDGTFAIQGPETQIDFGYRAVHLTTVYAKKLITAYYGAPSRFNYWIGCSSGGKQGLKEVQMFPEDYDGVIAGAAAQWWTHLNGWTVVSALYNAPNTTGHLTPDNFATLSDFILSECDSADGLADGQITDPSTCHPPYGKLSCAAVGANQTTCLSTAQIVTAYRIHTDWKDANGTFLFPAFYPGAEAAYPMFDTGEPFGPGPDFFQYQVLNETTVSPYAGNETETLRLLKIADATDPGNTNAINGSIQPFFKRGGKLITYVGMADWLIPSGSSIWYWHHVVQTLGYDPRDSYRLFTVPGMGHCAGGNAAFNFGGPGQRDISTGGAGQPPAGQLDAHHDMIAALIAWTEGGSNGTTTASAAPDYLVGTKYVGDDARLGISFQRRLCPYPQFARYNGGNSTSASSFSCSV